MPFTAKMMNAAIVVNSGTRSVTAMQVISHSPSHSMDTEVSLLKDGGDGEGRYHHRRNDAWQRPLAKARVRYPR